tara:strand:+ start:2045 stop:2356 length:312 start_codon:yes stop_codon:yes gene_type:complete
MNQRMQQGLHPEIKLRRLRAKGLAKYSPSSLILYLFSSMDEIFLSYTASQITSQQYRSSSGALIMWLENILRHLVKSLASKNPASPFFVDATPLFKEKCCPMI